MISKKYKQFGFDHILPGEFGEMYEKISTPEVYIKFPSQIIPNNISSFIYEQCYADYFQMYSL